MKDFCHWHVPAKEKESSKKPILACTAHLNEAHAFVCPYNEDQIYRNGNRLRISQVDDEGNLVGRCEDFKPSEAYLHEFNVSAQS
jgi:hypothetical protein